MISLTQLNYIVALDDHGSFKKAAKACFVTQPTLSMQIQKLEENIDALIFDRSRQPIKATIIGRRVIEQARIILADIEKIEAIVHDEKDTIEGEVRLGIIPTLAPYLLPLFTKPFLEAYPKVKLRIEETKTEDLIEALKRNQIDVGLLVTPIIDDNLVFHSIFNEPFYVYASCESELSKLDTVDEKDLKSEGLLLLTEGHCMREQMLSLCRLREKQTQLEDRQLRFESGSIDTLIHMVDHDNGFTVIPHLSLPAASSAKGKIIDFSNPKPSREVSMMVHRSFAKTSLLEALLRTIKDNLPEDLKTKQADTKILPI